MSRIGVPSRKSAPSTCNTGPSSVISTRSSFTQLKPSGLGLKGLRVANTPTRSTPPSRGGRTVGDHLSFVPCLWGVAESWAMSSAVPPVTPFSNCQINHKCVKLSIPATADSKAYSGSNMMRPCKWGARKLLRGIPNFYGRSVRIWAIGFMGAFVWCGRSI